ncbi:Ig-like domain-containing protein [Neobacillus sp. YIM B06451]|uniref:Ig-like domain-containing protein n=1 Tax=Neobacillus sp. YIM B06451 TaxID=3070994 RepID=UPI002931F598|nr:Ig-like domain-containing protein [Neobacillus sp. YIM B06451]
MKKQLSILVAILLLLVGTISPAYAAEATLTVNLDQDRYPIGSIVTVSGTVHLDGQAARTANPTMQVKDPSGSVVAVHQWNQNEIGNDGSFSTTYKIPNDAETGGYSLLVSALGKSVTKEFRVEKASVSNTITVSTDKEKYNRGNTIIISGAVSSNGAPVSGTDITITVEKDGSALAALQIKSGPNGIFVAPYQLSADAETGTYTVKATFSAYKITQSTSFTVELPPAPPGPDPKPDPKPEPGPGPGPGPSPGPGPGPVPPKAVPAPIVNEVGDQDTVVTGSTENGFTIQINAGMQVIGTAKADGAGKFSVAIPAQKAGTVLEVTALDNNGQKSSPVKVTVKDKTPPAGPEINSLTDQDKKITGSAEPGSRVSILRGDIEIGRGMADKNGAFSIPIQNQKAGTTLSVISTDAAGNSSAAATVEVTVGKKAEGPAPKVYWDGDLLKKGQIGRVTIEKPINLWKREGDKLVFVRVLKPGERYRVYNYDSAHGGQYGLGSGYYVTNMKGYVKYQTPSKAKLKELNG